MEYLLVILLIIFILVVYNNEEFINIIKFNNNEEFIDLINPKIPNIIWTYWDGDIPYLVNKCMNTWKKYNPTYKIIILNRDNLSKYLPEVDFTNMKNIESSQHFSDMVRVHILAKEGGIWSDASIVCLSSYDWIHKLQQYYNSEFIGYYIESQTLDEYKSTSPIVENWFFACIKNSKFVNDWRDEYLRITTFNNRVEYINDVKKSNTSVQNIINPEYLAMHVSAQKLLQNNNNDINKYKLSLLKAEDDAFKYLILNNWNSENAINNIINCVNDKQFNVNCDILNTHIIKLRGSERYTFDSLDNDTKQKFYNFLETI